MTLIVDFEKVGHDPDSWLCKLSTLIVRIPLSRQANREYDISDVPDWLWNSAILLYKKRCAPEDAVVVFRLTR